MFRSFLKNMIFFQNSVVFSAWCDKKDLNKKNLNLGIFDSHSETSKLKKNSFPEKFLYRVEVAKI